MGRYGTETQSPLDCLGCSHTGEITRGPWAKRDEAPKFSIPYEIRLEVAGGTLLSMGPYTAAEILQGQ